MNNIVILLFILLIYFIIKYKIIYKKITPNIDNKSYNLNNNILSYIFEQTYLVNNLPDAQEAANILANILYIINILIINIMREDIDKDDNNLYRKYINIIYKKLPSIIISEAFINSKHTSYNINKGEKIVLCIRDKKTLKFEDINEILYVAIHEIAHIGCPELNHTPLFIDINRYLLKKAACMNLYKYIDYNKINKKYCGLILNSSVLNDNFKCYI